MNPNLKEFFRYLIVGGTAFLVDFFVLFFLKTYVFKHLGITGIYIATAIGFICGLIYNYILSIVYVFETAKSKNKGKTFNSFILFSVIGMVGLGLTELGMFVGVEKLDINYLFVKFIVAGIVLIWNYGARKILVF